MVKGSRHIVVAVLLTSYLLVGVIAHLDAFTQFLGFGSHPVQVTQSKPDRPIAAKVYWTQYKHIPSVTKAPTPSPAVVALPEPPPAQRRDLLRPMCAVAIDPVATLPCRSSRAPPKS